MSEAALIRLEAQPTYVPPLVVHAPANLQEAIATLPADLQEPMQALALEHQERRQAAIAVLLANKTCPFTQEEMGKMDHKKLEGMVAMASQGAGADYRGQGGPARRRHPEDEAQPPEPPDTFAAVVALQKERGLR